MAVNPFAVFIESWCAQGIGVNRGIDDVEGERILVEEGNVACLGFDKGAGEGGAELGGALAEETVVDPVRACKRPSPIVSLMKTL